MKFGCDSVDLCLSVLLEEHSVVSLFLFLPTVICLALMLCFCFCIGQPLVALMEMTLNPEPMSLTLPVTLFYILLSSDPNFYVAE